jgi:hypothetical protein
MITLSHTTAIDLTFVTSPPQIVFSHVPLWVLASE